VIAWLLACAEPPLLDAVAEGLAADAVDEAEPAVRLVTGITGILAEGCAVTDMGTYVYTGAAAAALGATTPTVLVEDNAQTWTFDSVGLDGDTGELVVVTDLSRAAFAITWTGSSATLTAGLEAQTCDAQTSAAFTGTGTWTVGSEASTLTLLAIAPTVGLTYAPSLDPAPSSGQLRWTKDIDKLVILLDDASSIDADAGTWPGNASGKGWTHPVELALP
jgi:hypothetical protein